MFENRSWNAFLLYLMLWILGFSFADAFFEVIHMKPYSKMLASASAFLIVAIIYHKRFIEEREQM